MTGREIVQASLAFAGPERIAMTLPVPYPHDVVGAGIRRCRAVDEWRWDGTRWLQTDEWGNLWCRVREVGGGEVIHGAIEDGWSLLDQYVWPDLDAAGRYDDAAAVFSANSDRYRLGSLPGFPFAIARYMRRMEVFLADILLEPQQAMRLLQHVTDLLERCIHHYAEIGADGVFFCEDWGTQDRLLVSPSTWREVFRPGFRQLCDAARSRGLSVWMHSCGHIYEIIEDLVEVGVAVLQFDQPELHGVDNLARDFGGRVNFWCPVDIQRSLQARDAATIESAARELVAKLGCYGGGFIAGYYGDNAGIGLDRQWQEIACRAFVRYGGAESRRGLQSPGLIAGTV